VALFQIYVDRPDGEAADFAASKALKLWPECWSNFFHAGKAFLDRPEPAKAVHALQWAIRANPEYAEAYALLGKAHLKNNNPVLALQALKIALKLDPNNAGAYHGLAEVYTNQPDLDKAAEALHRCIALKPKYGPAHAHLGYVCNLKKDWDASIKHLQTAVELSPEHEIPWSNLGHAWNHKGQFAKGLACLKKAAQLAPKNANTLANLGQAQGVVGDYKSAQQNMRTAVQLAPKDAYLYMLLGQCQRELGELKAAQASMTKARSLVVPASPQALNIESELKEVDDLEKLGHKTDHFAKKEILPGTPQLSLGMAKACRVKSYYAAAYDLFSETAAQGGEPALQNLTRAELFNLARLAALAGTGQGNRPPAADKLAAYRANALKWLRALVDHLRRDLEQQPRDKRYDCLASVGLLLHHVDLAAVRPPALDKLPAAERQQWQDLWADVHNLYDQAEHAATASPK
jgi:tetratricopeptide (TPR) repeat protein